MLNKEEGRNNKGGVSENEVYNKDQIQIWVLINASAFLFSNLINRPKKGFFQLDARHVFTADTNTRMIFFPPKNILIMSSLTCEGAEVGKVSSGINF